jgi:hypothetical protein
VYSDKEAWFYDEAKAGNTIAIKALNSRPEIPEYLKFVWDAFWALSGDRQVHMGGVGMIPFLAIDRYAERFGVTDADEFSQFFDTIRTMDAAYLRKVGKQE